MSCVKIKAGDGSEMVVGSDIRVVSYLDATAKDYSKWGGDEDKKSTEKITLDFIKPGTVRTFMHNNTEYNAAIIGGSGKWRFAGYRNKESNKFYTPPQHCQKKKPGEVKSYFGGAGEGKKFTTPTATGY